MAQLNVAVVGGGLAGLATAVYLTRNTYARVTLFEAAGHLGGQAGAWRDADGDAIETGIHLAFPWYVNFQRLYRDVDRPLRLVQTDGNYYILDGRTDREYALQAGRSALKTVYGLATFPGLTRAERLKLARHVWRVMRMSDAAAERHDGESVTEFLQREHATPGMIRQLALAAVTIQGLRPEDASAASYIKFMRTLYGSVGAFEAAFFDAPLDVSLVRPLVEMLRRRGVVIRCGTGVAGLDVANGRVTGVTTVGGAPGGDFDAVVLAVPGYLVPRLLPEAWRRREPFAHLTRLTSAQVVTLTLWYRERVLPDRNVRISNRDGVIFDAVADKAHHWRGWTGGSVLQVLIDAAEDLDGASDQEIYQWVLRDLERFFPRCATAVPRKWHLLRHREIYCATRPGYWSLVPRGHATPLANLYLAGDYTAGPYHYGMESAVISGKEVARLVLDRHGFGASPEPVLPVRYLPFVRPGRGRRPTAAPA